MKDEEGPEATSQPDFRPEGVSFNRETELNSDGGANKKFSQGGPESDFKYILSDGQYRPNEIVGGAGSIREEEDQPGSRMSKYESSAPKPKAGIKAPPKTA
jgi:hypothetical protein